MKLGISTIAAASCLLFTASSASAATILQTFGGNRSTNYSVVAEAGAIIGGPPVTKSGLKYVNTEDSANYFDASLGRLDSVVLEGRFNITTTVARTALCETLLGLFFCTMAHSTSTETSVGINYGAIPEPSGGPPLIGGVPAFSTGDQTRLKTYDTSIPSLVGIFVDFNPPQDIVNFESIITTLTGEDAQDFVGGGAFEIVVDMRSETLVTADCELALIALCQAFASVTDRVSYGGSIAYNYTPFSEIDPDPVDPDPSVIPLPAGAVFMLTAIGSLWVARRKQRAA